VQQNAQSKLNAGRSERHSCHSQCKEAETAWTVHCETQEPIN